ncbi:MAG: hypothetical protein WC412_03935 [Candidatus Omnitrophota bacterium]|jgi:hypothetical protein
MKKFLGLTLVIVLFLTFPVLFLQAQTNENITITTYYPSPYGIYHELRSKRMAIGDNYYSSDYCWPPNTCTNQIDTNTDLVVEGNVGIGTASPQRSLEVAGGGGIRVKASSLPTSNLTAGDIAIDSGDSNTMKWYNGTTWASAGGGSCYVAYFSYIKDPYPYSSGGAGYAIPNGTIDSSYPYNKCLTGFTDQGSLGPYGGCWQVGTTFGYFLAPGSKCDTGSYGYSGDKPFYIGEGHLCCK